jgi:hypothetical protein
MGTQKGKLFELAAMYHTYQKKKVKDKLCRKDKKSTQVAGKHFDEGKSINLTYSVDMYPEVLYDSYKRNVEEAAQMSFTDFGRSEAFYVEPFGHEETIDVPYGDEDRLNKAVSRRDDDEMETEKFERDEEKLNEMEEKLDKVVSAKSESFFMEETPKAQYETNRETETRKEMPPAPVAEKSGGAGEHAAQPYEVSDEEFAKDIGAILTGQKVYDAEQKKAVSRSASKPAPVPRTEKSEPDGVDALDPSKNEHKIFEKIAQSMQYANSYNLGAIALEERFEKMEKQIEEDDVKNVLRTKPSGEEDRRKNIQEAYVVEEEPVTESMDLKAGKFDPQVPLDHTNGGRAIRLDQLQKGDMILASSSGDVFDVTGSADSISGIYIGGGKVLTKGDTGTLEEKQLPPLASDKGVMAVLRHQNMTTEKAGIIVDSLTKLRLGPEKHELENWVRISCPAIGIHPDVCNAVDGDSRSKCNAYTGKVYLGTMSNDSFRCAGSIMKAFESNQLGFVSSLTNEHNGTLKYFGHLKK